MMEKLISCCGLDCVTCDARIATLADDDVLRAQTAEKWKVQFSPDIVPEMINCTGCREAGVKFAHCSVSMRSCTWYSHNKTPGVITAGADFIGRVVQDFILVVSSLMGAVRSTLRLGVPVFFPVHR